MLLLKLYLCDYVNLAALQIRVNKAKAKCAKIKGTAKIKGFTVIREFTKGFPMKTSLINILCFVSNSNNNHYFTNYSTYNRSKSTKVPWNRKTDFLINN